MMRLTMAIWWTLALAWLLGSQEAGAAGAPEAAATRVEIKGYGPTIEVARREALREATQQLAKRAREQSLRHWAPSEAFVEQQLLDGVGRVGPNEQIDDVGTVRTWVLTVKMPSEGTLAIWDRQAARLARSEVRLSQTLHVVALLFVVLTIGVGYVRLDDWTRSRYTPWLRVAGAAAILGAGAGWWWSL